ncbi:MAG: hypothetical protein H7329_13450 [Opitutaceae bacterium]|nr:hypothetical protein [Cytophagales bacterium]
MKNFVIFTLVVFTGFTFCTKKKPDPTPTVSTTPTTNTPGNNTTTGTNTSSAANTASFNDGVGTTIATEIQAQKDTNTGHITISMIKAAGQFPTTYISIASPSGTGTYKDDQSTNTYGQIKYSSTDTYTTDFNKGGTCTINVTELTSSKIVGNFTFTGKNSSSATKTITGSFNCPYTIK